MKLSKTQSKKIINKLPSKWSKKLLTRLTTKGIIKSEAYIQAVVYGQKENLDIIQEAILLKTEHQKFLKDLKNKI